MNTVNIVRTLLNQDLKVASRMYFDKFVSDGNKYTTNRNLYLEAIIDKLLARHCISLKEYGTDEHDNNYEFNKSNGSLLIVRREKWMHCECYYAQLLLNLSRYRRINHINLEVDQIDIQTLVDVIVAYAILDYLHELRFLCKMHLSQIFIDAGGEVYAGGNAPSQLKIDEQLNLILNHLGNGPISFEYVDSMDFHRNFNPDNKSFLSPAELEEPKEFASLDEYYKKQHGLWENDLGYWYSQNDDLDFDI